MLLQHLSSETVVSHLSSETVVNLSMGQLITVVMALIGAVTGLIAYTRKEERAAVRLARVEERQAEQSTLNAEQGRVQQAIQQQLNQLSHDVATFVKIHNEYRPKPSRSRKTTTT